MTKGYDKILDAIWDDETREEGAPYFEKYWLDDAEYSELWLPVHNRIFDPKSRYLPDVMFSEGFKLYPLVGGDIFVSKKDFLAVTKCSQASGDMSFVIVQNPHIHIGHYDTAGKFQEDPLVRFKYPSEITWEQIKSGGHAATEHFDNGRKDYFVFGDSGNWGRYVGNSYATAGNLNSSNPLNIMGFKEEFAELFKSDFEEIRKLEPEITPEILVSQWLPNAYKQLSIG